MTAVYEWVRNITCYLIFMTVITNLLPNKKYEKYIRLFAGMVLILIVLKPLTSGLRLDDQIAYFFESITFQSQAEDFKKELAGMEEKRLGSMVEQYESAVQTDVERMAKEEGLCAKKVKATIESDRDSGRFGTVTSVFVVLGDGGSKEENDRSMEGMEPVEPIKPVESVEIGSGEGTGAGETGAVRAFRKKLIQYYNLEAQDVEIQLEDG